MDISMIFSTIFAAVSSMGLKILYAIIVLVVGSSVIKWVLKKLKTGKLLANLDPSVRGFSISAARVLMYILLALVLIGILDLPTTGFITMLASCSVAVGLALQGALANLAGGIILLIFHPFRVGDFVEAGGHLGTVMEINIFYTVLNTLDNRRVTIPNGNLTGAAVVNFSTEGKRRVDLTFNAAYSADMEMVKQTITEVAEAHPLVLKGEDAPAPIFVRVSAHGASAVEYTVRVWTTNAGYWDVYFDMMEGVKKAFDAKGIEIPYSQVVVHQG